METCCGSGVINQGHPIIFMLQIERIPLTSVSLLLDEGHPILTLNIYMHLEKKTYHWKNPKPTETKEKTPEIGKSPPLIPPPLLANKIRVN